MSLRDRLIAAWYRSRLTPLTAALWPLSLLFSVAVAARRLAYRSGVLRAAAVGVPVIVVGSIVLGGTGKTPLARALAAALRERGQRPGLVARGYGGTNTTPRGVAAGDDPVEVGDEPLLYAADDFPVWIGHDRAAAARALLAAHPECDVVIADDGLQHYGLERDFEIAVIDATRGLGNGCLLPAGPLREPRRRLDQVDAVVVLAAAGSTTAAAHGDRRSVMRYEPLPWRNLARPDATADPGAWRGAAVHAVAGIGDPARFFALVRRLGLDPVCHPFPDHHRYTAEELRFPGAVAVLMTQKDAVKCARFADARFWYLPIAARIDPALIERVTRTIRGRQAA